MSILDETLIILDGATGTELGRRGVDISLPLWSAHAVMEAPDVLEAVHRDYLEAGADALVTCTFRTDRWTLAKVDMADRAAALTKQAVEIARRARDAVKPEAAIFGSVAPLEDCYRPERAPDEKTCAVEHGWMIETLLEAGVDVILIETQNCLREARAAVERARALVPDGKKWMVSFCVKREGPPCTLLSDESLTEWLSELEDAYAVGANCVAAPAIESQIKLMRRLVPDHVRISAYANIGYADPMGNWVNTDATDPTRYASYADQWITDGASIVGGCCGTRPAMIKAIAEHVRERVG